MRLLLDTHSLLWFLANPKKLNQSTKQIIEEADEVLISLVSLWEIAIKLSIKKLELPLDFDEFVDDHLPANGITVLPLQIAHVKTLLQLPLHHRDPFDRLLIAQAMTEDIPLVSADVAFDSYRVTRLW
jgi:PIN domain nuclease of toxin-antitoxin system